jgi:hypothetical protein
MNDNKWKIGIFLSLILPLSFLVSLEFSTPFSGQVGVNETTVLAPAQWQFERPSFYIPFHDSVQRIYSNDIWMNATLSMRVFYDEYEYDSSPMLGSWLDLTVDAKTGFVDSVNVTFHDEYAQSFVVIKDTGYSAENLTATAVQDWVRGAEKGFINLQATNRPQGVFLKVRPAWVLESPANQTQTLTITAKVTYFNGTVYKQAIQPFELKLAADNSNTFDTATEVKLNQTIADCAGGSDQQDFFKFYVNTNDNISIVVTPSAYFGFELYLYNSSQGMPFDFVRRGLGEVGSLSATAQTNGWWFVEIKPYVTPGGIYWLNVSSARGWRSQTPPNSFKPQRSKPPRGQSTTTPTLPGTGTPR